MRLNAQLLTNQIINLLNERVGEYVLFYYGLGESLTFDKKDAPIILLPQNKLDLLYKGIKEYYPAAQLSKHIPGKEADILLNNESDTQLRVQCVHRLLYKSWCLLDEDEVRLKRVRHRTGFYMPSIEHLFEYAVLRCWMSYNGLADRLVRYFGEFHVLVQEDLLDYFNQKYATSFRSMDDLSEFRSSLRTQMLKVLKGSPANGFMKNVWSRLMSPKF